jgi:multidrug resistance efflux pump
LSEALDLKLNQLQNKLQQLILKVQSDSMEAIAANNDFKIATQQFNRQKAMFDSGLVSLTQLEQRNQSYQNMMAKRVSAENKLANTRQDLTITRIEMNAAEQEYLEKIAKTQGDQLIDVADRNRAGRYR